MKKIVLSLSLLCSTLSFGQVTYGLQAAYNLNGNTEEAYGGDAIDANVNDLTFVADKFGNASGALKIDIYTPEGLCIVNEIFCSNDFSVTFLFNIQGDGASQSFSGARPIFFVKKDANSYFERIMLAYSGNNLYLKWANTNGSVATTDVVTINRNEWYHAAITYSETDAILYLNGEFVGSISSNSALSCDASVKGYLGNVLVLDHAGRMEGALDRIRIYDRILVPEHVEEIFEYDYNGEEDILSLTTTKVDLAVAVVPNPAKETASVKGEGLAKSFDLLEVVDLNGRVHASMHVNADEVQLPVNNLSAGIYIAKLTGNTVKTVRFEVQK